MKPILIGVFIVTVLLLFYFSINYQEVEKTPLGFVQNECQVEIGSQVWVESGTFAMGGDDYYPDEGPIHEVTLDGFWIDAHEVTNAQFAEFIDATGYVTVAERMPNPDELKDAPPDMLKPGSITFTPPSKGGYVRSWWSYTPGANWKHPSGPGSSIEGKENFPVVQVAYEDAKAYADWAGRQLPTEAQFEFAARNKLNQKVYAWPGEQLAPNGKYMANTWQGFFPIDNSKADGFKGIAPVGCYDPNQYGAFDLIGNVWEWTANRYVSQHNPDDNLNPKGPIGSDEVDLKNNIYPVRVIKGGSYLCAPNYCVRYRPSARHSQDAGIGAEHIGFRTVSS
ncbi:MAG: formylglycine-generating enzyme family protein [Pseudomonadota bacterium]